MHTRLTHSTTHYSGAYRGTRTDASHPMLHTYYDFYYASAKLHAETPVHLLIFSIAQLHDKLIRKDTNELNSKYVQRSSLACAQVASWTSGRGVRHLATDVPPCMSFY